MAAFRVDNNGVCDPPRPSCLLPPPDFSCTPCEPCDPCENKCPPKVRAKDAICLSDDEVERCFSLYQRVRCEPTRIPAFIHCIALKIRRQGFCRVLTEECPVRADTMGNACFTWSDRFRGLPAGYYEGDLFIDGHTCFTLLFQKKQCWVNAVTDTVDYEAEQCVGPADCCVGCVPSPDMESDNSIGECDDRC